MSLAYAIGQSIRFADSPAKYDKWLQIAAGMTSGALAIGSRAPVANVPVWATLEVAHGGFATSGLCAGGPLLNHERALADAAHSAGFRVSDTNSNGNSNDADDAKATTRLTANQFLMLHAQGLETLSGLLNSRCYRLETPEEGALLVLAWLVAHDHSTEAQTLLRTIGPFMHRLRFHPIQTTEPENTQRVSTHSARDARETIERHGASQHAKNTQHLAFHGLGPRLQAWYTLRNQLLSLWLETLSDPSNPPIGQWVTTPPQAKQPTFVVAANSAWPCQQYPLGWHDRAAAVVTHVNEQPLHRKKQRKYRHAVDCIRRVLAHGTASLSGKDVAQLRFRLATANAKRGLPGSATYTAWVAHIEMNAIQRHYAVLTEQTLHTQALERLDAIAQATASHVLPRMLDADAANAICEDIGATFPQHKRSRKCIDKALHSAVAMALSDVFAQSKSLEVASSHLPTFSAVVRADAIVDDAALHYLYAQLLVAFASRRSLLLLNYASQVRISELPWVSVIDALVLDPANGATKNVEIGKNVDNVDNFDIAIIPQNSIQQATFTFTRTVVIHALRSFGEAPLCNPFIRELQVLLRAAGIDTSTTQCPIVESIAADIFMGRFIDKFTHAAVLAQSFLSGTAYQRYYNIVELPVDLTSQQFASVCRTRAGVAEGIRTGYGIANNGRIIEQCELLTTHNLATLFVVFALNEALETIDVPAILARCYKEIARLTALLATRAIAGDWRASGQVRRSIGNTWRCMLFYFAVLEKFTSPDVFETAVAAMQATDVVDATYRTHIDALAATLRGGDGPHARFEAHDDSASAAATGPGYVVAWGWSC